MALLRCMSISVVCAVGYTANRGLQHGGVGPMQGQANHFNLYAPEKMYVLSIPYTFLTNPPAVPTQSTATSTRPAASTACSRNSSRAANSSWVRTASQTSRRTAGRATCRARACLSRSSRTSRPGSSASMRVLPSRRASRLRRRHRTDSGRSFEVEGSIGNNVY